MTKEQSTQQTDAVIKAEWTIADVLELETEFVPSRTACCLYAKDHC